MKERNSQRASGGVSETSDGSVYISEIEEEFLKIAGALKVVIVGVER